MKSQKLDVKLNDKDDKHISLDYKLNDLDKKNEKFCLVIQRGIRT